MNKIDQSYKILILGETRVGKSSVLTMLTEKTFSNNLPPTLGIDYKLFCDKVDGEEVKLQIWDTAGQERFRTIAETFYRQSNGILVVFDLSDRDTFNKVSFWLDSLKEKVDPACVVVLVGNKADLKGEAGVLFVAREEIDALARSSGVKYFECSAKKNTNIYECFHYLSKEISSKKQKERLDGTTLETSRKSQTGKCCRG